MKKTFISLSVGMAFLVAFLPCALAENNYNSPLVNPRASANRLNAIESKQLLGKQMTISGVLVGRDLDEQTFLIRIKRVSIKGQTKLANRFLLIDYGAETKIVWKNLPIDLDNIAYGSDVTVSAEVKSDGSVSALGIKYLYVPHVEEINQLPAQLSDSTVIYSGTVEYISLEKNQFVLKVPVKNGIVYWVVNVSSDTRIDPKTAPKSQWYLIKLGGKATVVGQTKVGVSDRPEVESVNNEIDADELLLGSRP